MDNADLKPSVLKLPYDEWKHYKNNHIFKGIDKIWLREWENMHLMKAFDSVKERSHARYWHYIGFKSAFPILRFHPEEPSDSHNIDETDE